MKAGRLILPALRWKRESGFTHEDRAIDAALELGVGGFIVFGVGGGGADEIGRLTEEIRHRAGRPLLIGADLERGAGQQARRLTELPPPRALASLHDEGLIAWAGATTAREARRIGINWLFAPVADLDVEPANPIVQTRAFGDDPAIVSRAVTTWIRAAEGQGVLACAKHYPGHGRTRRDSHQTLPVVPLPLGELEATDLRPFRAAITANVAGIMTAHVAYPTWDPSGLPATQSPVILTYLRETLGFEGLIVTDAMIMEGARAGRGEGEAAVSAIRAGCDLLLYPGELEVVVAALGNAARDEALVADRIADSRARYERALGRAVPGALVPEAAGPAAHSADLVADRLLAGGLLRGAEPRVGGPFTLDIVDDDLGGWYPPGPNDLVRRALAEHRLFEEWGGHRVILVFAEARAAKGRSGLGAECLERLATLVPDAALVVLFGHPRLAGEIPGTCPVLCAWHRQPLMQYAVARWLQRRLPDHG